MNITNNGKKIINVGTLTLLPGQTAPLPEGYEGNPVVAFLIGRGTLTADQPFRAAAAKAPLKDDAADAAAAEAKAKAEEAARAEAARQEAIKGIKKMNRAELDAACAKAGIEVTDADTIPTLQEKLIAALQEA
jgi:hypothetical protein